MRYEAGEWIEGNRSVERVRIMARHMALQARPFEHQCFMVENMANGTAAAYILQLPKEALADLKDRHHRLGPYSPKASMLASEAKRIRTLAESIEAEKVTVCKALEFVSPYLANEKDEQRFRLHSRKEAAHELRGLASFLSDQSALILIETDQSGMEQQIAKLFRRHSKSCQIVAFRIRLDSWQELNCGKRRTPAGSA